MGILTIPLRNLRRKPLRTAMMVLVFAAGVAAVTALAHLSSQVGESLEAKMTAFGANILITPQRETLNVTYGGMQLGDVSYDVQYLDEAASLAAVRGIHHRERISAVAPKFVLLTRIAGTGGTGGTPVGVIGVDFPQERLIKSYWGAEGRMPEAPHELLAGASAAAALGLKPGDNLSLEGTGFSVSGVLLPTGSDDDNVLFADLHALQQAAGKPGAVHFIEVSALCAGCPIEEITEQLAQALPGARITAMQQVVKQRMMTVHFVQTLAVSVSVVILLTACVMIGLSVFSSVNERIHEIGLLRALGFSKGGVFAVFSLEAVCVGLLAGTVGYLGGVLASGHLAGLLDLGSQVPGAGVSLPHFLLALSGVPLLAALAALPPALKAARVEPSQALVML